MINTKLLITVLGRVIFLRVSDNIESYFICGFKIHYFIRHVFFPRNSSGQRTMAKSKRTNLNSTFIIVFHLDMQQMVSICRVLLLVAHRK